MGKENTVYWHVPVEWNAEHPAIKEAAELLRKGQCIAFPTETVYGLGADARSDAAVEGIFWAKGRPSDNPLIVHIGHWSQLDAIVAHLDETSRCLMTHCWPGPLTVVLPVKPGTIASRATAGLATVGVRMPDHPVALSLLQAAGIPIAAPSANRSGRPSPTCAAHVQADLDGLIAGIVDGGATGVGVESTVVEVDSAGRVHVLRPGGVSAEAIRQLLPEVTVIEVSYEHLDDCDPAAAQADPAAAAAALAGEAAALGSATGEAPPQAAAAEAAAEASPAAAALASAHATGGEAPRSPGMKYRHYAPKGQMAIVQGEPALVRQWMQRALARAKAAGETTGVLAFADQTSALEADVVCSAGDRNALEGLAQTLYAALRLFDERGVSYILAEGCHTEGLGQAIMNRMMKAASNKVIAVESASID